MSNVIYVICIFLVLAYFYFGWTVSNWWLYNIKDRIYLETLITNDKRRLRLLVTLYNNINALATVMFFFYPVILPTVFVYYILTRLARWL